MDFGKVTAFVKAEPVLTVSAVLALASMFIVPPSMEYVGYIKVKVLCVVFCFMACVAGLSHCGVFESLAAKIMGNSGSTKKICLLLVMTTYVGSMFMTNDMALITFVPLSMAVLTLAGLKDLLIPVIVMQTIGANMGSMITPFGSPHNLLVFGTYDMTITEFASVMLPLMVTGTILMLAVTLMIGKGKIEITPLENHGEKDNRFVAVMVVMFILSIAAVLGFVPYQLVVVLVFLSILLMKPKVLKKVDYGLLLTFVFLFIFTGNLSQIEAVSDFLGGLMEQDACLTTVVACQFISNVPATITLSGFTTDWAGVLAGVNIGGFGTPIASMASIISLRFYSMIAHSNTKRYLAFFLVMNFLVVAVLLATWYLL